MKTSKSLFGMLIVTILFASCSSTNLLTLSVSEPAPVYLSENIQAIGIVNRSLPSDDNVELDKLDKLFSAEGKNLDKEAANIAVKSLTDELQKMNRFSDVTVIDNVSLRHKGIDVFPATISWEEIDKMCVDSDVNAIYELSFFDTDATVTYEVVPVELKGPLGIKIPAIENHATVNTLIKTGWRIYDPQNRYILDEYLINDRVITTGKGINPAKALEAILGRKDAVFQVSNHIGYVYALRILPYSIRVNRDYYVRGTNNFKIGKRRAQTGDWDGAAELWEQEISNPKMKIAGRAYYNMAIINEINGDLDAAVDWASRSYTDYKNKKALRYINILKYRINKRDQLEQQMN